MKKERSLRDYYKESFYFIASAKKQIIIITTFFLVFAVVGYFVSLPPEIENLLKERLGEIAAMFEGLGLFAMIWKIFSNNVYVSFLSVVFGVLFGIFPLITAISNGFIIGYVANKAVAIDGLFTLWKLLPHGIFELPAVIISLGIGLKLGSTLMFKSNLLKKESLKSLISFLLVVVPLLIIAAIIEGALVYFFK